jgi:hypothetical protein
VDEGGTGGSGGSSDEGTSTGSIHTGDVGGPHDCGGVGSHSEINEETDECECDPGYVWCNPDDPNDYECCASDDVYCPDPNSHVFAGECVCNDGYEWCVPDDPNDLSCCPEQGTDTGSTETGGTGTEGTGTGCGPGDPPPEEPCEAGTMWCTSIDAACPGDYYVCEGTEWVLDTITGAQWCTEEGYDNYLGCYDDAVQETIFFICE